MSDLPRPLHDAYGHVALPRFLSGEEFLRTMDAYGVGRALVCTAETCPDLAELSRTACRWPDRLAVAGLPLGESPEARAECVRAQMEAGFRGIRIHEAQFLQEPELGDAVGREGGLLLVVGSDGLAASTLPLLLWLDRHPEGLVLAPHFASGGEPRLFDSIAGLDRLFRHPRFCVIFSRQGMFRKEWILPWARAVLDRAGPDRVLWGSEYPVALYRDETYAGTARWFDEAGLFPDPAARWAFFHGNAARALFSRTPRRPLPLDERWCRMDLAVRMPVWLFPNVTVDLPEPAHRGLLEAYLAAGGERGGSYRAFVTRVLADAAGRLGDQR